MGTWKEDNLLRRVRESEKIIAENKSHLEELIEQRIKKSGYRCDLNDIDVSQIIDMSGLFSGLEVSEFNGDISEWDVSNVKNMDSMFEGSEFNGDISQWDVSNVRSMNCMFHKSDFNRDISDWDVSNVKDMGGMFAESKFNKNISQWNVSKAFVEGMFEGSPLEGMKPRWYERALERGSMMFPW